MTELSTRERKVCDLVCNGLSNKEIALCLELSPRTVEDHRANVMKKYRVDNVVKLVRAVYKLDEVAR